MILRIVKMTFKEDGILPFKALFDEVKFKIMAQEGCHHLELWQDFENKNVLFTYSHWESPIFLEKYRNSELFIDTWAKTKIHFSEPAKAWSVEKLFQASYNKSNLNSVL